MTLPSSLPTARSEDPLLAPTPRWGILGPGWIAERFAKSLKEETRQQLQAVGGRSLDKAKAFADRWSIAPAHGSTGDLVADASIDAVYIATPHHCHFPDALAAVAAGKHVLVEKPLTLNAGEATKLDAFKNPS